MKLTTIDLDLSHNQYNNLLKGKTITLKHTQIGKLGVTITLKEKNKKKLETASKNAKGKRLSLDTEEITKNGEGFMSSLKKLGKKVSNVAHKTVDLYHDHVKDTAIGRKIKQVVKDTVKDTIKKAPSVLASAVDYIPGGHMVSPLVEKYGDKLADKYSDQLAEKATDKLGLGLERHRRKAYGEKYHDYMGRGLEFNRMSPVLGTEHASLNPSLPFSDMSVVRIVDPKGNFVGHGFLPAGYR